MSRVQFPTNDQVYQDAVSIGSMYLTNLNYLFITMDQDYLPTKPLSDGQTNVGSSDGSEGGSQPVNNGNTLSAILSRELGKNFTDDASALKAVKDTFGYVGTLATKVKEYESKADPDLINKFNKLADSVEENNFYADHPEYKGYADVIKRYGSNPAEVVKSEDFQRVYSKLKSADEFENSRSVLMSNPRLGQVKDTLTQANEARVAGNHTQANSLATRAVLEAYEQSN